MFFSDNIVQIVKDNQKGALVYAKMDISKAASFFKEYGITNTRLHNFNRYLSYIVIDKWFKDVLTATEYLNERGIEKSILDSYQEIN